MKKDRRNVYLELAKEINASLCCFCRHGEPCDCGSSLCDESDDGYYLCNHPIEKLSYANINELDCMPGDDCYGFTPSLTKPVFLELISILVSNKFTRWLYFIDDNSLDLQAGRFDETPEGNKIQYYKAKIEL